MPWEAEHPSDLLYCAIDSTAVVWDQACSISEVFLQRLHQPDLEEEKYVSKPVASSKGGSYQHSDYLAYFWKVVRSSCKLWVCPTEPPGLA